MDRRDEILAKKAKLAELKRQRAQREKEFASGRQSIGGDIASPSPSRADSRKELDSLISSLVDSRPGSTGPGGSTASPARRSRPTSVANASQLSGESFEHVQRSPSHAPASPPRTQKFSVAPLITVYETPSEIKPKPEYVTYSKAVQTDDALSGARSQDGALDDADAESWEAELPHGARRNLSKKDRDREEELRANIRREIEEELKALQQPDNEPAVANGTGTQTVNFPARALTSEEVTAVTASEEFLGFVEQSSKVIERALENEYDILADYALRALDDVDDDEDGYGTFKGKGRRVKEVAQFWDERWSKRRIVSDIAFSPKFPELMLAAYTKSPIAPHDPPGIIQVWNMHMPSRPEYILHGSSDILCAKFSPFHPHMIVAGTYSGQVLLWDTRKNTSLPQQQTPLTGAGTGQGHSHPIYSIDIVGTPNANNIISCSTDGVVCAWSSDMLTQPAEYQELALPAGYKNDDIAPTCIAFPANDATYFLAGTEEGSIYACHRYERAGANKGVDARVAYKGHAAAVMSLDFHSAKGIVDLSDLVISSSLDWSVKIWRARPPAAAVTALSSAASATGSSLTGHASAGTAGAAVGAANGRANGLGPGGVAPLLEITREDLVYDVKWSPVRPGVFACVDGAGSLELWDVNVDVEVPVAKVRPSDAWTARHAGAASSAGAAAATPLGAEPGSLSKCAWEPSEGRRVAVGGMDGVISVFEVGSMLGGRDARTNEESIAVKKKVSAWERGQSGGGVAFTNGR